MNYNVMKRPMFKMGGKAASQGTGITSGLDEKVNMADGRANYAEGPTTYQDFLKSALEKQAERDKAIAGMDDLITLRGLGRVGQFLSTEESNNPFEIFKNLAKSGTEIVLPLLSERKKQELLKTDPKTDLAFAKALKPDGKGFTTKLKSLEALKNLQSDINKLQGSITTEMSETDRLSISSRIADLREQKRIFLSGNPELQAAELFFKYDPKGQAGALPDEEDLEKYRRFTGGNAEGGIPNRVNRAMGSDDDGELPPDPTEPINPFKPKPIKPLGDGKMDVAMETQGRGNQVFDMLRARLPQEITDDVVQLISYNKEAFADFASIKNQEDVTSFNEKYGVQLVIDVATV